LAGGFRAEFAGEKPPDDLGGRQRCARAAVNAVLSMDVVSRWDATRARLDADQLQRRSPDGAAPLSTADGAALVYLITHAKLGAAKVGIADMSGLRLAQHRRNGWQILAVFQVSAKSAADRCRSRPVTIARDPRVRDSATFSACWRHTLTVRNSVSPSFHSAACLS